jgi:citrate synthase
MSETATLTINGESFEYPVITGSEGERAIDIATLRRDTGLVTMDPGFVNTGSCVSDITFINGEEGILRYFGYAIEDVAEKASFDECCYLMLYGELPNASELADFRTKIDAYAALPESLVAMISNFPKDAHPMGVLSSLMAAQCAYYPNVSATSTDEEIIDAAIRLMSNIRTMAAFAYRHSQGLAAEYPDLSGDYCADFLNMMFGSADTCYAAEDDTVQALHKLLIMHADHEQNCSTSTVRFVGSSNTNLNVSIAAGVAALWGPLHGGANQAVMDMLTQIDESDDTIDDFIARAKDKSNSFRLMGFGHRVYKNYDPRAKVIKAHCQSVLASGADREPLLDIAMQLEQKALADEYFTARRLYPNVDFYSGLLYKAMGFPADMFTVLFAIGRLPGWIGQWKEMVRTQGRIGRPRQVYNGPTGREFPPIDAR